MQLQLFLSYDILLVGLEASENLEYVKNNYFDGWKVHIHEPYEFPEVARKGIIIGTGQEVSIHLSAETTEADSNVKEMAPSRRKCLLGKVY